MNDRDFILLRDLIAKQTGLHYPDHRRDVMEDRLAPLLEQRGLKNFLDYYYFLRYEPEAGEEWLQVHSVLAVSETYFWREFDHFSAVNQELLPSMFARNHGRRVRIWHAGCASGEEPYTHAMHLIRNGRIDQVELFASDADVLALGRARRAQYGPRAFRSLPLEVQQRFFTPVHGPPPFAPLKGGLDARNFELSATVRDRVSFSRVNLADPVAMASLANSFDIIFCRNVFIYFNHEMQERVAHDLWRALRPGGHVFVGLTALVSWAW